MPSAPLLAGLDRIGQSAGYKMWSRRRHLLDTDNLASDEISVFLDTARTFKALRGNCALLDERLVATIFFENSTRTRTSFDVAARRLGAQVVHLDVNSSSVSKGETIIDTTRQLVSMGVHAVIQRHQSSGAADLLVSQLGQQVSIINAGDGWHAHPTQALLDLFTMIEIKPVLAGSKIAIVGDIAHSRVARSNMALLCKMGADVHVAGPPTLLPPHLSDLGVTVHTRLEPALEGCQFVMALRLQLERQQQGLIPSLREYVRVFRIDRQKLKLAAPEVRVLHPGPVNRAIELADDLVDDPDLSLISAQVANGVPCRMAVLYLLLNSVGKSNER